MGEKIVVGPVSKGFRNDVTAFNIDNDSFPTLQNAYQWRGRIKRKRGTSRLGRLIRYFNSNDIEFNSGSATQVLTSGNGNLITGFSGSGIQVNSQIVPGFVTIVDTISAISYTDPSLDGTLSPSGSINYGTGAITIAAAAGNTVRASFNYYPMLPVMGLEDLLLDPTSNTGLLGFDTTYSYNVSPSSPYTVHAINFYKNLETGTYVGYIQKTLWTSFIWNGADYQQFWSTNYQGAFWTFNGIKYPFVTTNIGMQYKKVTGVTIDSAGPPATATLTITAHGLVVGDFLFLNQFGTSLTGINFQTCYVIAVPTVDSVQVELPIGKLGGTFTSAGIAQYLTNNADETKDCIKWYDGSPVTSANPPVFETGNGWVNFCPPLSNLSYSISDLPSAQYYLVGAKVIIPFKDRLLFVGPVVQTALAVDSSSDSSQVYLQDTVIYSQNGTPYYTASFDSTTKPLSPATVYEPILVPVNQTAQPVSFWEDQTGLGGFIAAGFSTEINTVSANEDVLIMGFGDRQALFAYTGNDILPFQFFVVNSELGSGATFSSINLDRGVMTVGSRGFIITSQTESKRFDLDIPDQVFQIELTNNGARRICAARDFVNEWIYFTYESAETNSFSFPTQTLQYNYRDQSWALFNESYTTYGLFRKLTGFTWDTIGSIYPTWDEWNDPWDSGTSTLLQPEVIAGNAQGFLVIRADGTGEAPSVAIGGMSFNLVGTKITVNITSVNHCLNEGDYIVITGALGTVASLVNGKVFSVSSAVTADSFNLNPQIANGSYTYLGNGLITRMYIPLIQSKQFPVAWGIGRKTRLGPQQYLLSTTANSQITLLIFLSQDAATAYNAGAIVPDTDPDPFNNGLIYSTVLYTCPESTNLGLTPANTNLQMLVNPGPTAGSGGTSGSKQIWHRVNTSLIGDTVQVGFTMSDEQMRDPNLVFQFSEIEIHSMILDVNQSSLLS